MLSISIAGIGAGGASCSPESSGDDGNGFPTTNGSGGAATGGGDGQGASVSGGGVGTGAGTGQGGGLGTTTRRDPSDTDGGNCGAVSVRAESVEVTEEITTEIPEPLAIYLMLDQSGSMQDNAGTGTKWQVATNAIRQFINDPQSQNLDVALQFFPVNGFTCPIPTGYSSPAVPAGRLPDPAHIAALDAALNAPPAPPFIPLTPIEGAINGLTEYCKAFQGITGETCVAVLITDGEPTECNGDNNFLSQIAANAWASDQVRTFAIGMQGANLAALDQIAIAGGAVDCQPQGPGFACDVRSTPFIDALRQIRDVVVTTTLQTVMQTTTLACEFELPVPDDGEVFDKEMVNVQFSAAGTSVQSLGKIPEGDSCANYNGGWYYDDEQNPTKILVCDATCSVLESVESPQVDVLLDCPTEEAIR